MSTALAIATVSGLLRELLQERMDTLTGVGFQGKVTANALLSELVKPGPDPADHLDLFLYLVTPNPGWRNAGLPSRNSTGDEVNAPPLALDLHYLVSASSGIDLHAEIMLGHALQVLHENPVLARDLIRAKQASWAAQPGGILKNLAADTLADQIELVKISPVPMHGDDIAKLWAGFQIKYRTSAVFTASVVLIESEKRFKTAPPVMQARVHAIPFVRPQIQALSPQVAGPGDWLTIEGQNLASDTAQVRFNALSVAPDVPGPRDLKVKVPATLRAGVVAVQVVHSFELNPGLKPADPPVRFESNVAAFMLAPRVVAAIKGGSLEVQLEPKAGKEQRILLLLDEVNPAPGANARAWRIDAPALNEPETGTILFSLTGVDPGTYFVRVQVDGSQSALGLDPSKPGFGPKVKFPEP